MAVSAKTQQLVQQFESECGHLFDGFYVQYTMNSENEIYIAFDSADGLALARLTRLAQKISNSVIMRSGDEIKSEYPFVAGKIVLVVY